MDVEYEDKQSLPSTNSCWANGVPWVYRGEHPHVRQRTDHNPPTFSVALLSTTRAWSLQPCRFQPHLNAVRQWLNQRINQDSLEHISKHPLQSSRCSVHTIIKNQDKLIHYRTQDKSQHQCRRPNVTMACCCTPVRGERIYAVVIIPLEESLIESNLPLCLECKPYQIVNFNHSICRMNYFLAVN